MPEFKSNLERIEQLRMLVAYLGPPPDGSRLSWLEIEQATGIKMTPSGKNLVRKALKRLHRPYQSIPGNGIELSSAANGMEIVGGKVRRVVAGVRNVKETTEQVGARHLDAMSGDDRQRLIHVQSLFNTIQLSASLARKALK